MIYILAHDICLNVHIHNLFNSVCIVYPCSLGCSWKLVTLRDHLIMDNHPPSSPDGNVSTKWTRWLGIPSGELT